MALSGATPGVYRDGGGRQPAATELPTGIPALLGFAGGGARAPVRLSSPTHFRETFPDSGSLLSSAVQGFFANGGRHCVVVALDPAIERGRALDAGLAAIAADEDIDLICAPAIVDGVQPGLAHGDTDFDQVCRLQQQVLEDCDRGNRRLAILDAVPGADIHAVRMQRARLSGTNGALYYPWLGDGGQSRLPPCGHVAGIYARSDAAVGVHKAPANEALEGVDMLERRLSDTDQAMLNPHGINAIRAFPGRGIRVWGARTVSPDTAWTYVNVRRVFLTAARWIERAMQAATFEPHDYKLWGRVTRELSTYFTRLHKAGALAGATPEQAFTIKCDAELNPADSRAEGRLVAEIGLAPSVPNEFVVVRIVSGGGGVTIIG